MQTRLSQTFALLAAAAAVVIVLSVLTLRRASSDLFVECRGELVVEQWGPDRLHVDAKKRASDFRVEEGLRVTVSREGPPACNEIAIPTKLAPRGRPAWTYDVRSLGGGRHAVLDESKNTIVVFRYEDRPGRRFVPASLFSVSQLPSLLSLVALGALLLGVARARRAAAYANRMHAWTEARLRPDGLLESEGGTALGTVDRGARVPAGAVIVDKDALEGHDVYRALPVIVRGRIAAGSHERWLEGTMRRVRDARTLAVLATFVAAAGFVARLVA